MITWRITPWDCEGVGLSEDTKPLTGDSIYGKPCDIPNGSKIYEMDTQKFSMWDLEHKIWLPQNS